jgi:3-hydroxybutyryl-CoA dehydratase
MVASREEPGEFADAATRLDGLPLNTAQFIPNCERSTRSCSIHGGARKRSGTVPTVAKHLIAILSYEELTPGDEWESPARTVTEADVVGFAGISGDFNPIHVDHHASRSSPFGRPVAHGLLGLSIASGLAANSPRVATLAFLAIEDWKFLKPIAFGDTVHVLTRVESVQPRARGRRALVTWRRQLVNQDGDVVQEGTTRTLVQGKTGSTDPEANDPPAG